MSDKDAEPNRSRDLVDKDVSRSASVLNDLRTGLALKIIATLAEHKLTMLDAATLTGVARSDYSRIRNARLKRFTLDRLIAILCKLDKDLEVEITFRTRHSLAD